MSGEDVDGAGGTMLENPATPVNEGINRKPVSLPGMRARPKFIPDTTFAFDARDDAAAIQFMRSNALEPGRFACIVPRYRWTPYETPTRQGNSRSVYNSLYTRADHDKLQVAMIDYVRTTGHKVAIVPETVQVVGALDALLRRGLPTDVAAKTVVMNRYWLPDEAASLFAKATVVVSIENHSPILAATVGTPFVMVHQPEDSFKSDMFTDIGLDDWHIRDINAASGVDVSRIVMDIVGNPVAARRKLSTAMRQVAARHRLGMRTIRQTLGWR